MKREDLLRRFRVAFPTNRDYHCAFGFFKAIGLSDHEAHALAESASQFTLVCEEGEG